MERGSRVSITGGKWEGCEGIYERPNGSNWVVLIDGETRYILPKNISKIKAKPDVKSEPKSSKQSTYEDDDKPYSKAAPKKEDDKNVNSFKVGIYNLGTLSQKKHTDQFPNEILGHELSSCGLIIAVEVQCSCSWDNLAGDKFKYQHGDWNSKDMIGVFYDPDEWKILGNKEHDNETFFTTILEHISTRRTVVVTGVHLPVITRNQEVRKTTKDLIDHLKELQGEWNRKRPIYIVAGDFNQPPISEEFEDIEIDYPVERVIKSKQEFTTVKESSFDNLLTNAKTSSYKILNRHKPWELMKLKPESWHFPVIFTLHLSQREKLEKHPNWENDVLSNKT